MTLPLPDPLPEAITEDALQEAVEGTACELFVAISFLVPKGTDVRAWFGEHLAAYRQAVEAAAAFKALSHGAAAGWKCKASRTADPPQDCDWPVCGCDDHATKVIEALQESGWQPSSHEAAAERACTEAGAIFPDHSEIGAFLSHPPPTPEEPA